MTKPTPKFLPDDVIHALNNIAIVADKPLDVPKPNDELRHPLLYVDFWFILIALGAVLAMMSSQDLLPTEAWVYIAACSLVIALISNLSRDRERITVYRIKISKPKFEGVVTMLNKVSALRQGQIDAGVVKDGQS